MESDKCSDVATNMSKLLVHSTPHNHQFPTKTNYEGGSTYSSNALREAREIENVLSKKRFAVHNNYWIVIFGIAGALDFLFYCLVELEIAIENDPNINDFNTKGRRSIERLSLQWKKEEDLTV